MPEGPREDTVVAHQLLVESVARLSLKARVLERLLGVHRRSVRGERRLAEIVSAALEAVPSDVAALRLRNGDGELAVAAVAGPEADRLRSDRLAPGEGLQGACLTDRRTIALSDLAWDARCAAQAARSAGFEVRSLLVTPVLREGVGIGVIELANKQGSDEFQSYEIELVESVARTAAEVLKPLP